MSIYRGLKAGCAAVISAVDTLRTDGVETLLAAVLDEYEDVVPTVSPRIRLLAIPPYVLLNELHLLLEEGALAFPTAEEEWRIVEVPGFDVIRRNHTLATVEGTRHGSAKHERIMSDIYSLEGFVEIVDGDVVVDTGAYVGGFTFFAADRASEVLAIEPNAAVSDVLRENTAHLDNVTVLANAAWHEADRVEINTSVYQFQNSAIAPDDHDTGDSFQVEADTVPALVRERDHESIDFLKIEAEGVEPEILRGALDDEMEIAKIAVDASPERDGEDAVEEIVDILSAHGYVCRTKDHSDWWWGEDIVFARRAADATGEPSDY